MNPMNSLGHVAPKLIERADDYPHVSKDYFQKHCEEIFVSTTSIANGASDQLRQSSNRDSSKSSSRKKGGWRITSGMRTKDAFEIKEGIHRLAKLGKALSAFITLRPPSEIVSDRERQDWCRRRVYNIRRKVMRYGIEFIALTVVEKPIGGQLHIHVLVYIPDNKFELLKKMESLPQIDVRRCHNKHQTYILKNRLPTHPDFERELKKTLPRQKGSPFRGKRWSFSPDARRSIALAIELPEKRT